MEIKKVILKCKKFYEETGKSLDKLDEYINFKLSYEEFEVLPPNKDGTHNSRDKAEYIVSIIENEKQAIRTFDTGANRNSDEGKLDFEGFLCPRVLTAYAEYMNKNRHLEDGSLRDSDNWQKGIPQDAYMKSMYRHFMDVWKDHRGIETPEDEITNLCALLFNVSGMLHEKLKIQASARKKS